MNANAKGPKPSPATGRPASLEPSRLTGVSAAQPRQQSEFIRPGEYMLTVKSVREGTTRPPKNRPYFLVVATVQANDDPDGRAGQNRVGHDTSWMVMLDLDGALRDVRSFLDAVMTDAEKEEFALDEHAFIERALSDAQPFEGRTLMCSAANTKTKSDKDFTKVRWFPAPPQAAGG